MAGQIRGALGARRSVAFERMMVALLAALFAFLLHAPASTAKDLDVQSCEGDWCYLVDPLGGSKVSELGVEKNDIEGAKRRYGELAKADTILRKRGFTPRSRQALLYGFTINQSSHGEVAYYIRQTFKVTYQSVADISWDEPIEILKQHSAYAREFYNPLTGRKLDISSMTAKASSVPSCYAKGNPVRDCKPLSFSPFQDCYLGDPARKELLDDNAWKIDGLGDLVMLPTKEEKSRIALANAKRKKQAAQIAEKKAQLVKQVAKAKKTSKTVTKVVNFCENRAWDIDGVKTITVNAKGLVVADKAATSTAMAAPSTPDASLAKLPKQQSVTGYTLIDNYDVIGGDLGVQRGVGSATACAQICNGKSGCSAFSFDKWNRICFLKKSGMNMRLEPKTVSGYRSNGSTPQWARTAMTVSVYRGKSFPYQGYRTDKVKSFDACTAWCQNEAQCVAYSFVKSSGSCRLLSSAGEYFSDGNVDSGVKRQAK
ncbi:MAG: hypothetical protein KDJ74_11210 [Notoacmeibacter sp.]|nr:hypothetical protein [Notoacmeibacter sp.]